MVKSRLPTMAPDLQASLQARARRFRRRWEMSLLDAAANRRYATAERRFLVLRHPENKPGFYDVLLDWLAAHIPEARTHFQLDRVRARPPDLRRVALVVPWLQDPVQSWSPSTYRRMKRVQMLCDQRGIPVINAVERLTNAGKVEGARLMAEAGLRTPRMMRLLAPGDLERAANTLGLPLIVRDDWSHGASPFLARSRDELGAAPLGELRRPVAIEFIDVRQSDGLHRKFRYFVAGDVGVCQSVHASLRWVARGTDAHWTPDLGAEEAAFIASRLPEHDLFVAARARLELDVVAFDFSRDARGGVVVWEANPYPHLHFATGSRRAHRDLSTTQVLAAMTHLYFSRAGLPTPKRVGNLLPGATGSAEVKAFDEVAAASPKAARHRPD